MFKEGIGRQCNVISVNPAAAFCCADDSAQRRRNGVESSAHAPRDRAGNGGPNEFSLEVLLSNKMNKSTTYCEIFFTEKLLLRAATEYSPHH